MRKLEAYIEEMVNGEKISSKILCGDSFDLMLSNASFLRSGISYCKCVRRGKLNRSIRSVDVLPSPRGDTSTWGNKEVGGANLCDLDVPCSQIEGERIPLLLDTRRQ